MNMMIRLEHMFVIWLSASLTCLYEGPRESADSGCIGKEKCRQLNVAKSCERTDTLLIHQRYDA